MKKYYPSHIILCIFLICFGSFAGYFAFTGFFSSFSTMSIIALLFSIPAIVLVCVLPIYAGISYLIEIIRGKDSNMYPDGNASDDTNINNQE